jgi:imidazole glycerol-phosphate synthase subunit HisH
MSPKICILNYGSGNVKSVYNAFKHIGMDVNVSNDEKIIRDSTHLVLPGVGAFRTSVKKIFNSLPMELIEEEVIQKNKPFLGICVGMQVLSEFGLEFGITKGIGWLEGHVRKMISGAEVLPHVGWNQLNFTGDNELLRGISQESYFYFVHSYILSNINSGELIATSQYSEIFPAVVQKQNIFGVQFHPEKSQKSGLKLLSNFSTVR